ncbi:hypothetical protein K402DRAFT_209465 [Aulographum hederae CBS 113979]|uniref:Uncharacterized protein n=1 Tax=Aulographum hederae CBS 113979 TaxID=1176131 RepID=A0A6G1GMJ0_9PEZI|nr:hypothetical protein K402DRAFT_209465 [Aulographum hederae CBS 113979]
MPPAPGLHVSPQLPFKLTSTSLSSPHQLHQAIYQHRCRFSIGPLEPALGSAYTCQHRAGCAVPFAEPCLNSKDRTCTPVLSVCPESPIMPCRVSWPHLARSHSMMPQCPSFGLRAISLLIHRRRHLCTDRVDSHDSHDLTTSHLTQNCCSPPATRLKGSLERLEGQFNARCPRQISGPSKSGGLRILSSAG